VTRRKVVVAIAVVIGTGLAFTAGYVVGRGDRAPVPDLYGLGLERGGEAEAYVALKHADLRLGRVRLHICGDDETRGMVVRQSPPSGDAIPVGSAVDVWLATPVDDTVVFSELPGLDDPCRR
jgi:beta-lactam-binding protein with PASTA domain